MFRLIIPKTGHPSKLKAIKVTFQGHIDWMEEDIWICLKINQKSCSIWFLHQVY